MDFESRRKNLIRVLNENFLKLQTPLVLKRSKFQSFDIYVVSTNFQIKIDNAQKSIRDSKNKITKRNTNLYLATSGGMQVAVIIEVDPEVTDILTTSTAGKNAQKMIVSALRNITIPKINSEIASKTTLRRVDTVDIEGFDSYGVPEELINDPDCVFTGNLASAMLTGTKTTFLDIYVISGITRFIARHGIRISQKESASPFIGSVFRRYRFHTSTTQANFDWGKFDVVRIYFDDALFSGKHITRTVSMGRFKFTEWCITSFTLFWNLVDIKKYSNEETFAKSSYEFQKHSEFSDLTSLPLNRDATFRSFLPV